jgi:MoxR-like ATPase
MALFTRGDRTLDSDVPTGLAAAPFGAPRLAPVAPAAVAPVAVASPADVAEARRVAAALVDAVEHVVAGRRHVAEMAAACLFSRGHLLIEDIPGVGKTLLAQAIAAAVGGSFHRIQGTSDLLPGDVTGALVPDHDGLRLRFRPGPVFANVVVFDELNRTNPRTQSALLEAAEEATVTVDGTTHDLPDPFFLVATQNPLEIAGTFRLGEGALDRFAAVITPGRAGFDDEVAVLAGRRGRRQLHDVVPVTTVATLAGLRTTVDAVAVSDAVARYVVELLDATRHHPRVRLGASTRGGLSVVGLARAYAVMRGRGFVVPDDVASVVVPALAHRVLLVDGNGATTGGRDVVLECLDRVRPPTT